MRRATTSAIASIEVVVAEVIRQPLQSLTDDRALAHDGLSLRPALEALWGGVPDDAWLLPLKGDLSTRSYLRVGSASREPATAVAMCFAPDGQAGELPFVNVQRHLAQRGVRVPRIYVDRAEAGVLLLEDLGDETFEHRLHVRGRDAWPGLYQRAVTLLADLHARIAAPDPHCIAYARGFDRTLLRWELEHFRDWGLRALGSPLVEGDDATLDAAFAWLVDALLALPQGMAHRDYQSRNLMWVDDTLVVIDFQDALRGPAVYDLVALLCDSYVALDAALQHAMIAHYAALAGQDVTALTRAFALVAVQRKLKDAGRMVFADRVRGNASFLQWFGPSLRYVARALAWLSEPALEPLTALLARAVPGYPEAVPTPLSSPPPNTSEPRSGARAQ